MELQQRTRRFGCAVILCACLLRWIAAAPFLIYSETGHSVRFSAYSGKDWNHVRESPAPRRSGQGQITFGASDASLVEMDYDCDLRPDVEALLEAPLAWELTSGEPAVLILHTHATESYADTPGYRTEEPARNMLAIGEAVAAVLEAAGIGVLHDRQLHDHPSYNGSYVNARASTEEILEQHPSIRLILDLHRDALEDRGQQLPVLMAGEACARLMLVVGTNVTRPGHTGWEENLSLALKLHVLLERQHPGIMRPVNLRQERFNQDLLPGALLIEVGAAGNTRQQALCAARYLGEAVAALVRGSRTE